MKCINCEKEMQDGLEQCPHCGCHYPVNEKPQILTPEQIDKTLEAKQVKTLIDTAVAKGYVTAKERKTILSTAKANHLDVAVTEIMLDSALEKAKKDKKQQEYSKPSAISQMIQSAKHYLNAKRQKAEESVKKHSEETEERHDIVKVHKGKEIGAMRYCRYCGTPLSLGAICCRKCGKGVNDI